MKDQIAAEAAEELVKQFCAAVGIEWKSRNDLLSLAQSAIEKATEEKQSILSKYVKAMDAIYNHNEEARAAVIQYFGIHHITGAQPDSQHSREAHASEPEWPDVIGSGAKSPSEPNLYHRMIVANTCIKPYDVILSMSANESIILRPARMSVNPNKK